MKIQQLYKNKYKQDEISFTYKNQIKILADRARLK